MAVAQKLLAWTVLISWLGASGIFLGYLGHWILAPILCSVAVLCSAHVQNLASEIDDGLSWVRYQMRNETSDDFYARIEHDRKWTDSEREARRWRPKTKGLGE